jgi:hypothetical protein
MGRDQATAQYACSRGRAESPGIHQIVWVGGHDSNAGRVSGPGPGGYRGGLVAQRGSGSQERWNAGTVNGTGEGRPDPQKPPRDLSGYW